MIRLSVLCCVVLLLVLATCACFSACWVGVGLSGSSVVGYIPAAIFFCDIVVVYYHDSLVRVGRVAFACPVRCGAVAAARLVTLLPTATWLSLSWYVDAHALSCHHHHGSESLEAESMRYIYIYIPYLKLCAGERKQGIHFITRQPCMRYAFGVWMYVALGAQRMELRP